MKPHAHGALAISALLLGRSLKLNFSPFGLMVGSLIPDIDFILFVPFMGRMDGHRTITHSLLFIFLFAILFRKQLGFFSTLIGGLLHLIVDDLNSGIPPGVAWLWPIIPERIQLFGFLYK